jgi:dTDP-4-amino-4,6-dideoxygalactose transaminase
MRYKIPLSYNPIDIDKLTEVLYRYEGVHHNQIVADFEREFKDLTGTPHAVALNSGTSAIHLALKVLGVRNDDIVLAPSFTYVATINPILYLGAEPVFVDSESDTWNMDPVLLDKAIKELVSKGKKPKAIIVVHTYGMPAMMDEILHIAEYNRIPIVEDAAESLGSAYKGKHTGLIGDIGVYSFNNNKVLTTYGGGLLVTKNEDYAVKSRFLASQARQELPHYEHREIGFNYAMSPLSAAAGLAGLPTLKANVQFRRALFDKYKNALAGLNVHFQPEIEQNRSNRWFSTLIFKDEATKARVISVLGEKLIETRPLWHPMHLQPVFKGFKSYDTGVSTSLFEKGLCLPSGGDLTEESLSDVTALIREIA